MAIGYGVTVFAPLGPSLALRMVKKDRS
jgi:hypothetical protein